MEGRKPVKVVGSKQPKLRSRASSSAASPACDFSQSSDDKAHHDAREAQGGQQGTGGGHQRRANGANQGPHASNESPRQFGNSRHFDEGSRISAKARPNSGAKNGGSGQDKPRAAPAPEPEPASPKNCQQQQDHFPQAAIPTTASASHQQHQKPSSQHRKNTRPRTRPRTTTFQLNVNSGATVNSHCPQPDLGPGLPSPTAKLSSKARSISYTSPLELLAEESKLDSGKTSPLTEENLRSLLRSFDAPTKSPNKDHKTTTARIRARDNHKPDARAGASAGADAGIGTGSGTPKGHPGIQGHQGHQGNQGTHRTSTGLRTDIAGDGFGFSPAAPPFPSSGTASASHTQAHPGAGGSFSPLRPRKHFTNSTGQDSSSFMPKSKSPKKNDKARDRDKKKSTKHDPDTHPLNLPPDQLHRLYTAQMAREEANNRASMSVDRDMSAPENSDRPAANGDNHSSSPPATPSREAPGAFPEQSSDDGTDGTNNGSEERSPTPPPHKVTPPPKVDPEACKAAGNKFFKAKDYERAIVEYTKAVEAEPSNPTYLSNRSAAYMSAGKYSQALGDSLQASRLDPGNDKILHRLARIYTSLGRPQSALDTYAKIPNASATDTAAARKALSSIEMAERQIESEDGNGNMALWSIDQAKQTLGATTPMPRNWQILRAKANLKIGSVNALGDAQAITQSLMRENSMDAEAIALAGRALYLKDDKPRQGKSDYERAEDHFRQALNLDPDNAEARNSLRTMKKLDRARTAANDLFKRGRFSDAVTAYTEALTIDPANKVTNAKLLGNRALARIKIKEYDDARADCDQALKLDPTYTKARRTRAKATGESGDWEQAVNDYKAMLEENPNDAELNKELRNAELELKKSKRKDWYKILGVDKDAGDKEIERAYKRKAALLHPDKTMGDKAKEEEFKDCLEAKETLLDPQKRHMFDTGADLMEPGMGGMGGGFPGGFGGGGMGGGVQIDPEMLFNMMNGMGGGGGGGGGFPGGGGFRFSPGGGGRAGYSPFG